MYLPERTLLSVRWDAGWDTEPAWTVLEKKKLMPPPEFEGRSVHLLASRYTDYVLSRLLECYVYELSLISFLITCAFFSLSANKNFSPGMRLLSSEEGTAFILIKQT